MNILLIDDHAVVRQGLKSLIQQNSAWKVVAECEAVSDLNLLDKQVFIDLAIVDLSLKDGTGFDAINWLRTHYPDLKIIVLTMYEHPGYVTKAIDTGADAYVAKTEASTELIEAIKAVAKHDVYLSHKITRCFHFRQKQKSSSLTVREFEMFKHLALGLPPKKVAQLTDTMPKTVMVHRSNIYQKLGASTQFDLLKIGLQEGIFELRDLVQAPLI